ncbi:hypothetical protein PI125_g25712 [Phytophthora idaei]|nr:hypothetical protein PI125_g25712 [Phytophthora idaei]
MRITSQLDQVLGTTLATTPRHKAFHVIVELTALIKQSRRRTSLSWILAPRVTVPCPLWNSVFALSTCVHDANVYVHCQAVDLDETQLRVDWVESPQAVHNRVVGLERQVAQLAAPSFFKRVRTGSQT